MEWNWALLFFSAIGGGFKGDGTESLEPLVWSQLPLISYTTKKNKKRPPNGATFFGSLPPPLHVNSPMQEVEGYEMK